VLGTYEGEQADVVADDGSVVYVGTWPDADLAGALVGDLLDRAGVETTAPLPAQVRFARRDGLTWIANFREEELSVEAPDDADWYVGGSSIDAYDAAVTDAAPNAIRVRED